MLRGVPAIKAARSKPLLSQGIIRVGLRSWLAWVTCQGRSGTQRDGPRGCYSRSRLGALAAKQMLKPRLRLSAQGIREKSVPAKRLTVAEKYQQLKAQTERAGMTVKEKNGKIVVSRKKADK
jgi:hypothetical protein